MKHKTASNQIFLSLPPEDRELFGLTNPVLPDIPWQDTNDYSKYEDKRLVIDPLSLFYCNEKPTLAGIFLKDRDEALRAARCNINKDVMDDLRNETTRSSKTTTIKKNSYSRTK